MAILRSPKAIHESLTVWFGPSGPPVIGADSSNDPADAINGAEAPIMGVYAGEFDAMEASFRLAVYVA